MTKDNDDRAAKKRRIDTAMLYGAGAGVAIGAGVGSALGDVALGAGVGTALGAAVGTALAMMGNGNRSK